jgi:hypothetical protein
LVIMSASGLSIGFGSIRHARSRPAAHRFAYRSYFMRVPLRASAAQPWSLRMLGRNRFAPFSLQDCDHGNGGDPLAWITRLLAEGGVHDADGEIWLHAMPRVLGYVFNPVSFWFCHRADGALRAIVCEVNNTFAERHCYLLAHADGRPLQWGETLEVAKVFHVSPFCEVRGRYRFRFMLAGARFVARIDYHDDAAGAAPLLVTSIEGRLEPATERTLARAFLAYPLFTFGVIARIHWHALRLWLKRVPFFRKPAPPRLPVTPSAAQPATD